MVNRVVTLYQGDSSETFRIRLYDENGGDITSLTGYSGHFSLVTALGEAALISKAMSTSTIVDPDSGLTIPVFESSITPTESTDLEIGGYIAVLQTSNLSFNFRKEDHFNVIVETQGYEA